jgi:hypothetical protein
MNPMEQGAGFGAGLLNAVKDLPLWLLTALAIALDLFLLVPAFARDLPKESRWWVVLLAIVFSALAVARAVALGIQTVRSLRAARDAKRRFHLTPVMSQCYWAVSKQADESFITSISALFAVKNRSTAPVTLLTAHLVRPRIRGEVVQTNVFVRTARRDVYGSGMQDPRHAIPPGATLPATVHIAIRGQPATDRTRELVATIAIGDEEGNEQRVTVSLHGTGVPAPQPSSGPKEAAYAIADPIEKKVVSVLHSELSRYEICGRGAGGFGSIHIEYQGRALVGFAGDSWTPNSPQNQNLIADPSQALLKSDNLDALLALHATISDDARDRERLASSLLNRIDVEKGYIRVSYFIVCALWKLGQFPEALKAAKARLPQGEMRDFGLSNVLYMLNGLLRYRHPDFSDEMLDQIESFIDGMTEHTFQIREKVSAIRAMRLGHALTGKAV